MKESERKSGLFVVPGAHLGVIEEFTNGPGTYVEDGTIHSQVTGCTLLDMLNRQVSVYPLVPKAKVPEVGNIVTGLVLDENHIENDCEDCHVNKNYSVKPTCEECHDEITYPDKLPGKM